jgi:hypothetical protein
LKFSVKPHIRLQKRNLSNVADKKDQPAIRMAKASSVGDLLQVGFRHNDISGAHPERAADVTSSRPISHQRRTPRTAR